MSNCGAHRKRPDPHVLKLRPRPSNFAPGSRLEVRKQIAVAGLGTHAESRLRALGYAPVVDIG
jgi:hypothetical protein